MTFLSNSRGARNLLSRIITVLARFGFTGKNYWQLLEKYAAVAAGLGCVPTFAITAVVLRRHAEMIRELEKRGIEFAVHGYIHTDYRNVSSERQAKHFKKAVKVFEDTRVPYTGFRAPFLGINGKTPKVIADLGFPYDSSRIINWNVIDQEKYKKWAYKEYCRLLDYYMPNSADKYLALPHFTYNFVEIPVSIPDDEGMVDRLGIANERDISNIWLDIMRRTYNRGELFTVQLHPERISFCEAALVDVIQLAKQQNPSVWIATLREIAEWWYEKDNFTLKLKPEGQGRFRVKANCTPRATLLSKNCGVDGLFAEWDNGYRRIDARDFTVTTPVRPVIGLSPDAAPAAAQFLKGEGYLVEHSERSGDYGIYLDDLSRFDTIDEKRLSERIEQSDAPLVRYWRWPDGHKSAISISGDIDSITLTDFVLRILENWWENRQR